jgi:hypothetical protein
MKTCSRCKESKPREAFSRRTANRDGLQNYCRECSSIKNKERPPRKHKYNPEAQRAYRERNRERLAVERRANYAKNPEKERARQRAYVARDPERVARRLREWHLKRKYGITLEQWEALFEKQGSVCAICGTTEPNHNHGWQTDHCHKTGAIRGILCFSCNLVLGHLGDDKDRIQRFYTYLAAAEQTT